MGYLKGRKGYLVLNLNDMSFSISRNVSFRETVFPFKEKGFLQNSMPNQNHSNYNLYNDLFFCHNNMNKNCHHDGKSTYCKNSAVISPTSDHDLYNNMPVIQETHPPIVEPHNITPFMSASNALDHTLEAHLFLLCPVQEITMLQL